MLPAKANTSLLEFWLDFKSSQNSLLSPLGTSIWQEGLDLLNSLTALSFFRTSNEYSEIETKAFQLLKALHGAKNSLLQKDFDVIGDFPLKEKSPLYRYLGLKAEEMGLKYIFVTDPEGEFKPWLNQIHLGQNFFKVHDNRIKVPFYSLNHERAHLCLFGDYYSNIDISDEKLSRLIVLVEWFCISIDLMLAYDLIRQKAEYCLLELESITNSSRYGQAATFSKSCGTVDQINSISNRFRDAFLNLKQDHVVEDIIAQSTLERHVQYANETLLKSCRQIPTKVSSQQAHDLIYLLETHSLTEIIGTLTGLHYE